ncbi:hypothetical protein TWF718_001633 [Orbilia javanica]|uniref:DUF6604 domain-containing protein n=1 Tax=Orbilia javanica TaxID=47235 RepID=A0AAN8NI32_9PEZI
MPALPEAIFTSYRRYKAGTNSVISFLVQYGHTPTAKPTSNGKSKATKQKTAPKATSYGVRLRDLVPFAKNVVDKGLKVPSHLLSILEGVVSARSKCAKWYRNQASRGPPIKHEKHEHFIRVLEQIYAILKPSENSRPGASQKSSVPLPKANNLFEYLDSEEPLYKDFEKIALDANKIFGESPEKPTKEKRNLTPEEARLEEQMFALFCFFEDVIEIRAFIGRVWMDYMKGQSGLVSVAITTTAALDLMRQANEELAAQFPEMANHSKVIKFFEDNGYAVTGAEGRGFDESAYKCDNVETISLSLALCVKTWYQVLIPRFHEKKPSPPKKVPKKERSADTGWAEFDCPDALTLDYMFLGGTIPDELGGMGYPIIQGFKQVQEVGILPSWLVISFDIISKLHQTLWLDGSKQPYDELHTHLESIKKQVTCLIKFSRTWASTGLPQLANKADKISLLIREPLEIVSLWTVKDIVNDLKSAPNVPNSGTLGTGKHFLLKNDPVLCGLILSRVRIVMHRLGLNIAAQDTVIGLAAQVYNAGLVSGNIKSKWTDMEDLINTHALDKTIFVGGRPDSMDGCSSRFFTLMGFSVRSRANGGSFIDALKKYGNREKLPYKILKDRREIGTTSVFAKIAQKDFKWCPDKLNTVFSEVVSSQIKRYLDLKKGSFLTEFENPSLDETTIAQWQKHNKLSQLQLLEVLHNSIEADDFHFNFDYISMTERCTQFLTAVDKASKGLLSDLLGGASTMFVMETWSNTWPIAIFDRGDIGPLVLKIACEALSPIIRDQGDVERQKNLSLVCKKERSSNYVDVNVVPTFHELLAKVPTPFEQILISVVTELFPNAGMHLIGINAQSTTSNSLAGAFSLFTKSRNLLSQIDSGEYDQKSQYPKPLTMSRREALLYIFLELLEKYRGCLRPATVVKSKRAALVLATRPELPLESLEFNLRTIQKEAPIFPVTLEGLKDRTYEAFAHGRKMNI